MERLIKARHHRRYIREADRGEEYAPTDNRTTINVPALFKSRSTINYILGGSLDDQYQLKCQHKKLLRAATVKARVNIVHARGSQEEIKPIDDPISFPLINPNRIIVPHHDALVLTLCINDFYVNRVPVDPCNAAYLLQLPAFNRMKLSSQMLN